MLDWFNERFKPHSNIIRKSDHWLQYPDPTLKAKDQSQVNIHDIHFEGKISTTSEYFIYYYFIILKEPEVN